MELVIVVFCIVPGVLFLAAGFVLIKRQHSRRKKVFDE